MKVSSRPLYLISSLLFGPVLGLTTLSGCSTLWQVPESNWVNQNTENPSVISHAIHPDEAVPLNPARETQSQPATKVNIARTINQAIAALGKGDTQSAQNHLTQVLAADPDNASANNFLEQIKMDPIVYFGPEYFEYKAGRGDSMTRIADRFLKDHLKFYILTRYNGMDNPASLVKGQVVRIPLRYKPMVARNNATPKTKQAAPSNEELQLASTYIEQTRFVEAIQLLESLRIKTGLKDTGSLLEAAYAGEAARLERAGELKRAALLYKKAAKLNPQETGYAARILALDGQTKARDHQRLASLYLKSGQLDLAMENINASLNLVPDSDAGKSLYQQIKAGTVNQYHTQAVALFNEDRFQEALVLWEQALSLDPTHLLSRSYHERCKTVLDRQQEFAISYTEDN